MGINDIIKNLMDTFSIISISKGVNKIFHFPFKTNNDKAKKFFTK